MKRIFLFSCFLFGFVSCQEKPLIDGEGLEINTMSNITVLSSGGVVLIPFTAGGSWQASIGECEWARLENNSGPAGTSCVSVAVDENTSFDDRSLTVVITSGLQKSSVRINQLQENTIGLDVDLLCVPYSGGQFSIDVESNVDYSVKTDVDWIAIESTKSLVNSKIMIDVLPNDGECRKGLITFSYSGIIVELSIVQDTGVPFFEIDKFEATVSTAGAKVKFLYKTNCLFEILPEESVEWVKLSIHEKAIVADVAPNREYGSRSLSFRLVFHDSGESSTSASFDCTLVLNQDGLAYIDWREDMNVRDNGSLSRYSSALIGNFFAVSNSTAQLCLYDRADGKFYKEISIPFAISGITNDSVGNLVFSTGGNYPVDEMGNLLIDDQEPLRLFAISPEDFLGGYGEDKAVLLVDHFDDIPGCGLNNIRVTGDVFGKAAISMCSASAEYGVSVSVAWQIENGVVTEADSWYSSKLDLPTTAPIWSSFKLVSKYLTNDISRGCFYIGEDWHNGEDWHHELYYNLNNNSEWYPVLSPSNLWSESYHTIDMIECGGHQYLGMVGMTYCGKSESGCMPSFIYLLDIDTPSSPVVLNKMGYVMSDGIVDCADTADICLVVEGDNLCAYVLDMGTAICLKVIYPLK